MHRTRPLYTFEEEKAGQDTAKVHAACRPRPRICGRQNGPTGPHTAENDLGPRFKCPMSNMKPITKDLYNNILCRKKINIESFPPTRLSKKLTDLEP